MSEVPIGRETHREGEREGEGRRGKWGLRVGDLHTNRHVPTPELQSCSWPIRNSSPLSRDREVWVQVHPILVPA